MSVLANLASPFLTFLKKLVFQIEMKRYRDAIRRNPQDQYLRARFAKYCLSNYFQDPADKVQVVRAVNQFENVVLSDLLDLEVFYLMGKFYQGQDNGKAKDVYRMGIRRYNEFVNKSVEFKHEQVETAFAIALNLLALESNHADPDLERFFKTIRRTYLKNFLEHKLEFSPEILGNDPNGIRSAIN